MGSQANRSGVRTFTAGETLAAFRLVKYHTDGTVIYADQGDDPVGSTLESAASGAQVAILLNSAPGTRKLEAAEAIDLGDLLWVEDDGKVQDTSITGETARYIALEAGSGSGSIIECATYF